MTAARVVLEEGWLDAPTAQPEHCLWAAVLARAVHDAREGGIHARDARSWLLDSSDFYLVAFYAGSSDPETLRASIRASLDRTPRVRRARRVPRLTLLTAPAGLPLWEIIERISRRARVQRYAL
jgi:hypothetical protein